MRVFWTILGVAFLAMACDGQECITAANREMTVSEDDDYVPTLTCAEEREKQANLEVLLMGRPQFRCIEETGHYDAYQCRGSVCYCTDCSGAAIQGFKNLSRWEVQDSTCKCARAQADFLGTGMVGLDFRCEEHGGHYKKLQCMGSVCRCAHPHNGTFIQDDSAEDLPRSFDETHEAGCESLYDELFGEEDDPTWTPAPEELEASESDEASQEASQEEASEESEESSSTEA